MNYVNNDIVILDLVDYLIYIENWLRKLLQFCFYIAPAYTYI